jgi:hypothetical protein
MDKTVVVIGSGEDDEDNYGYDYHNFVGDTEIFASVLNGDGVKLRGLDADVVVVPEDIDQDILNRVIRPMVAVNGGEIVRV